MTTMIMVIALVVAGFVLGNTRFARKLSSRRFMPVVYAAAAVFCAVRLYQSVAGNTRVWPYIILAVFFLGGAIESARESGIFRKS